MPSQATVTSKTGPGSTVTGQVITDITEFNLNVAKKVLTINTLIGPPREFDINATTTLTCTITAGANATIVVSQ